MKHKWAENDNLLVINYSLLHDFIKNTIPSKYPVRVLPIIDYICKSKGWRGCEELDSPIYICTRRIYKGRYSQGFFVNIINGAIERILFTDSTVLNRYLPDILLEGSDYITVKKWILPIVNTYLLFIDKNPKETTIGFNKSHDKVYKIEGGKISEAE